MVVTNDDLRFMKIYENQYGEFYQSIKKVFINGVIDCPMNSSNSVCMEIDYNSRCNIWQFNDYFQKRLELQFKNRDYSRVEFKSFHQNLWDDEACFIWVKLTDEEKFRSHSKQ